ncbi:GFA family protein [Aliterella atlantica]|uniref:GFA family protein n=1 Tax=Aliterella atlantica TaxID=1827278 RepID=UPI0009081561|nr:GFA family protein [Aliterella atlantica]
MIGSCLCGSVEFEIDGDEFNIYQCHCSLCKKQSGTTSNSSTIVGSDSLRFVKGNDSIKSWIKDTGFRSDFCSNCGSPVPNPLRDLDLYWVPVGLLPASVKATVVAHLCTSTISTWHLVGSGVAKFQDVPALELLKQMLAGRSCRG